MAESHELYAAAIEALGAKRVASALNVSVTHAYRLARHPMDDTDPDGTGARSDVDRVEVLVDRMAAHPRARAALHRWRLHFLALFRRAVEREEFQPLTDERLAQKVGAICREFGEFLASCDPAQLDVERLITEGSEAMAAIERLLLAAHAGVELEPRPRAPQRLRKV